MPDAFADLCRARGMDLVRDAVGNAIGWWPRRGPEAVLTAGPAAFAAIDLLPSSLARPVAVADFAADGARRAVESGEPWAREIGCFVGVHQDPSADQPVAVAGSVVPCGRWRFTFTGGGGPVSAPLEGRPDPLLTFAMTALAANKQARLGGHRATFTRVHVEAPGADAVAGAVDAVLDARARSTGALEALVEEVTRQARQRAGRDGTSVAVACEAREGELALDAGVARALAVPVVPAWAGGEAATLQGVRLPAALLVVRDGPGVEPLARALAALAGGEVPTQGG